jgi:hypothetical protein
MRVLIDDSNIILPGGDRTHNHPTTSPTYSPLSYHAALGRIVVYYEYDKGGAGSDEVQLSDHVQSYYRKLHIRWTRSILAYFIYILVVWQ